MTEQQIPITSFLADRLAELDDDALEALAKVACVPLRTARRAATGQPIKAAAAISLIAARGYDPITRGQITRKVVGAFDPRTLALFMNEAGDVNLTNVVKACIYLNIHPFDQCERVRAAA
jgi:hypothetical protein